MPLFHAWTLHPSIITSFFDFLFTSFCFPEDPHIHPSFYIYLFIYSQHIIHVFKPKVKECYPPYSHSCIQSRVLPLSLGF